MAADEESIVQILDWYQSVRPRRVDLIGDYAGGEPFIIDLDSLLLHVFADTLLDFNAGFQLLHAVHSAELFLLQLRKRKCNFSLAIFARHADLCVPAHAASVNGYKYRLARSLIIQHLRHNSGVTLDMFDSPEDPAFHRHMSLCGAYFLMAHDGSHSQARADNEEPEAEDRLRRARLRQSIISCMAKDHTVALINDVEFHDTKVFTMVLEAKSNHTQRAKALCRIDLTGDEPSAALEDLTIDRTLPSGMTSASTLLAILTLRYLNQRQKQDPLLDLSLLMHNWLLKNIPLSARRVQSLSPTDSQKAYLEEYSEAAERIAKSADYQQLCESAHARHDVADFVDGRLFYKVATQPLAMYSYLEQHSTAFSAEVRALWSLIRSDENIQSIVSSVPTSTSTPAVKAHADNSSESKANGIAKDDAYTLLPFSNSVFDPHLECVKIDTRERLSQPEDANGIFKELTHWHSTKPLTLSHHKQKPKTFAEQRAATRAMRRNQLRMKDMADYAASLTNSNGRVLEPESIFVQNPSNSKASKQEDKSANSKSSGKAGKQPQQKKGSAKSGSAQAIIAVQEEKRAEITGNKVFQAWEITMQRIEKETKEPQHRYLQVKKYLTGLPSDKADLLETETSFYCLMQLMQLCAKAPYSASTKPRNFSVAAMIWDCVNKLRIQSLNATDVKNVESVCKTMGFPAVKDIKAVDTTRKSAFKFSVPAASDVKIEDPVEFQLNHCGPYFDRSIEAQLDSRVRFKPDKWQRQVLDLLDQKKSAFVVAPTSAGKTFISFYAMKKVLQEDNDGILVYVAPTKALVNQISAEIQANFAKTYPYAGISVWALHTRDYRINEPVQCQILVTVPHVLQIMLMSPSNAQKFSLRVKRIIFDEIHCIGQAEDGLVWEQLLLLAPCPIIALSATVGNPGQFSDWLKETQRSNGNELVMVKHSTRYNDLRKYVYVPARQTKFKYLSPTSNLGTLGLDGSKQFPNIHPIISLVNKSRGMPEDLNLEPQDCLQLWHAMKATSNSKYPLPKELDPLKSLPETIRKTDTIKWEADLKKLLKSWMCDPDSPFDAVHERLYNAFLQQSEDAAGSDDGHEADEHVDSQKALLETTLPLLAELNSQDALPALIFNYDRTMCEQICTTLLTQLEEAENGFKETSNSYQRKCKEYAEYVKKMEKTSKFAKKAAASKAKGSVEDGSSKADMLADSAQSQGDQSSIAYFRPEHPLDEFSFADKKRASPTEIDAWLAKLKWASLPEALLKALSRGISVHHAGMNLSYRQCVEILFRKGFLRVVIATGTLALGINMPCKTVVVAGDSVFLTALNFRQAAGRAGRRGFDLLGNVVFHGVNHDKVLRLLSARLPDLNGHFPVTTSLVLRLFHLLNDSKQSPFAKAAINSLLSQPRLYLGGDDFKEQVLHHIRFSIEYLQRQRLLDNSGAAVNFAGCIMHLYYTESSSFAFHALLRDGFFHRLTASFDANTEERIMLELMLVMSHLFGRRSLRQAELEDDYYEKRIHRSPSMVFLPPLPEEAQNILSAHNEEVKHIFESYVQTFAEQHLEDKIDNILPLSEVAIGRQTLSSEKAREVLHTEPPTKIRSAFAALSGHNDEFVNIHELCSTARDGVFLEEAIIPHIQVYPSEDVNPLNAYLLDFFKHGDVRAIEEANGIRKTDIWFLLNDLSLVISTIVTALKNYMNLADSDMLDVRGRGDNKEDEIDDELLEKALLEQVSQKAAEQGAKAQQQAAASQKKKGTPDTWEDEMVQEEADSDRIAKGVASMQMDGSKEDQATFDLRNGPGLLKVLKAFERLKVTFDERFRAMWA